MKIKWEKTNGLIPVVIQDSKTMQVLMLGYFNKESLKQTQDTGKVTFFSRSRQILWVKGETSGNTLEVVEIKADCDNDAMLITVNPQGPTCHRNTTSCFDHDFDFLAELDDLIKGRFQSSTDEEKPGSYVHKLIKSGIDRMAQKVGEEAVETVIAAKNNSIPEIENESADLIFHLMVLLRAKQTDLANVVKLLRQRHEQQKPSSG